jgi:hypothetical protein
MPHPKPSSAPLTTYSSPTTYYVLDIQCTYLGVSHLNQDASRLFLDKHKKNFSTQRFSKTPTTKA